MQILLVSNMYPSDKYPHYGVFVKNSADILIEAGNQVDVIYIKKNDTLFEKLINYSLFYIKVIFLGILKKYDVIYAHYASHTSLPILILSKLKNVHIITNVHGNDVVPETKSDYRYIGLSKKLIDISDKCIVPSEYYAEVLVGDYNCSREKIVVYPSGGIDKRVFYKSDRDNVREELGYSRDSIYVGYVSRIEKDKGWDIFLRAGADLIKKYDNLKLVVVGSGDEDKQYSELVKELELEKHILKYELISQEAVAKIYNSLDVFVFPTYRKSESLGLVGLEAMACETVTVLPDKYGPASYAEANINCICFESGNYISLEYAIEEAIKSVDDSFIIQNALNTVERYSVDNTKRILLDVFNNYKVL